MPKSLIPVLGRPFAEIQLEWLASQGVTDVLYSIAYRGDMIRAALGDGSRFGVRLMYVDEGNTLLGTAGALRLALDAGLLPEAFFLLNGDSYLSVQFPAVEAAWRRSGCPVLMTVLRNRGHWDRSNAVLLDDGRVLYDKSPGGQHDPAIEWIDYGLSVLTQEVVASSVRSGETSDIAAVLRDLSRRGLVAGFAVTERFFEVGSPEGLRDLERHLASA
jgi:NDP-sugar pyrophosphorylase family protein